MPVVNEGAESKNIVTQMHHGDIYVYLNRIYLHDDERWYKANIREIMDIKAILSHKQLLIKFLNFNLILTSENYSTLLALRDFLMLSQSYFRSKNFIHLRSKSVKRSNNN